ncbi:ORF-104 [Catopsilia pomona nucleopolyhedrovirus]|uniref:ORF-104 n=1 Tax=Catopsilia pomona nucleopolyhedrovirus TaxID=1850906 RepID=A0A172WZH9_9ABAC|nr:ORF-104 [Catopsilia pomona nucleopolyhedrovirus]ANF29752.1 ORF-104 [Catopsilia pomona nucleopolyhedrovirus]
MTLIKAQIAPIPPPVPPILHSYNVSGNSGNDNECRRRPIPTPRISSLQQQICGGNNTCAVVENLKIHDYNADIQKNIENFKRLNIQLGHLGDVLKIMGERGKLLCALKDEHFEVVDKRHLNDATIEYLNYLQNDKLFQCRLCYSHAEWCWCEFHRHHIYRGERDINSAQYVAYLNSDMAVVSYIEEYYYCLSSYNYKDEAKRALKTLTEFESLADLMANYNFSIPNLDTGAYELMDFE